MSTRCDPSWQDRSPAYCPFSDDGACPSVPPCPTNRERVCVNGLDDEMHGQAADETPGTGEHA